VITTSGVGTLRRRLIASTVVRCTFIDVGAGEAIAREARFASASPTAGSIGADATSAGATTVVGRAFIDVTASFATHPDKARLARTFITTDRVRADTIHRVAPTVAY